MDNQRTQIRTQQQTQRKTKAEQHPSDLRKCPHCGAEIDKTAEFCPYCGKKLVDYCTFCGAPMESGESVCEECGMPASGVKCPNCGGDIIQKKSRYGKIFYSCANYPNCTFALWNLPTGEKCPQCGSLLVKKFLKKVLDIIGKL